MHNSRETFYVHYCILNDFTSVTALIGEVCDQVLGNVYVKYKTKILTTIILHDSWFTERPVVQISLTEIIYLRSKSLSFLVEDLKTEKENVNTDLLAEQPRLITTYATALNKLSMALRKCQNIAEAVEIILYYLAIEENHTLNQDAGFSTVSFMSSFYLGCNFVDFR